MKTTQNLWPGKSITSRPIATARVSSLALTMSLVLASTLAALSALGQSIGTAPPPAKLTAPGPQRAAPPQQQRQQQLPGTRAPQPVLQPAGAGNVEGFVFWDANTISHTPANTCTGLAVMVSVGNSSGGKSQAYTPLATLTNNFKYVGQVKAFLVGSKIKTYDVCTYGYDHVPVGPDLKVTVIAETASLSQPAPFSPMSVPQVDPVGPIHIISGQCNMLPRIVNPTSSDLFSHWGSCQNMAYDVNFMMQPVQQVLNSPATGVSSRTAPRVGMLNSEPPRGMLAPRTGSSAQPQSTSGTLLGNREPASGKSDGTRQNLTGGINGDGRHDPNTRAITDITNRGTPSSAGVALSSNAQTNPQKASSRQTLTNVDVVKMVKAGTPESVIVHSIESSNRQFDLSREGLLSLQQAHVSPAVLAAMCDGSARNCPENTGSASAPAATPGNKITRPARTTLKPIKLAPPTAHQRVTNPRLAKQNASIIAVLDQQRQAALQESAAMKTGTGSVASVAPARTAALSTNFRGSVPASGLAPGQTQSAPGNLNSNITHAPAFNSTALTCTNDPTPRVLHVSGGQAQAIFTPEAKYNQYSIVGCSFGQSQSGNSAYIFGANGFKANLYLDFWSENGITAHLDPSLAGVMDQNNVTLVISPAGKQQIQKQGFTFYAARGIPALDGSDQEVPLAYDSMARPNVSLFEISHFADGFDQLPSNATSTFPSFSYKGTPVVGWVFRYLNGHADRIAALRAHDCFINDVGLDGKACDLPDFQNLPRSDSWDFNKLAPGFAISSYTLYYNDIDPSTLCGGLIDLNSSGSLLGNWNFDLNQQNQIVVTWPVYTCWYAEFGTRDSFADQSSYGLGVWVMGPRCVDPWTAKKDQNCIAQVKQILG